MKTLHQIAISSFLFVLLTLSFQIKAQSLQIDVAASSNIFYSGRISDYPSIPMANCTSTGAGVTYLSDGTYPPHLALPQGMRSVQFYSYNTATVNYQAYGNVNSADGGGANVPNTATIVHDPTGAFDGLIMRNRIGMLTAVFLDNNEPVKTGVANTIEYTAADMNAASPVYSLGQTFFMGDGTVEDMTNNPSAQRQTFLVPDGATRIFLGFADAEWVSGDNRCYADNIGTIHAKVMMMVRDDVGQVQAGVGGAAVSDVRSNDYMDSAISSSAYLVQKPGWPSGITLDINTGQVNVSASVVAGLYENMEYDLCDTTTSPHSCAYAYVTVTVKAAAVNIPTTGRMGLLVLVLMLFGAACFFTKLNAKS